MQRAFSLARYLPDYGWKPFVLSANLRAHETTNESLLRKLPADLHVRRTFALDVARHLSIRGAYPDFLAYPDRWNTWWLSAVASGLLMIRRFKPDVIYSTYPIATAHFIGMTLQRLSGVPWVADFRDSMTEENYPSDRRKRRIFQYIESRTIRNAAASVFTAPGTKQMYMERYSEMGSAKAWVVSNGYDEDIFLEAERLQSTLPRSITKHKVVLLHSGVIYPKERDPTAFFQALAGLKEAGIVDGNSIEIRLRATGHDELILSLIQNENLQDVVTVLPPVSYVEAIREMLEVDVLVLMQAASCNHQIPAKAYEYLRARRPIFALTDPGGDTAGLLRDIPGTIVAPLDARAAIEDGLRTVLQSIRNGGRDDVHYDVSPYSRQSQIANFVKIFETVGQ